MGEHAEWTFMKGRGIEGSKMDIGGSKLPETENCARLLRVSSYMTPVKCRLVSNCVKYALAYSADQRVCKLSNKWYTSILLPYRASMCVRLRLVSCLLTSASRSQRVFRLSDSRAETYAGRVYRWCCPRWVTRSTRPNNRINVRKKRDTQMDRHQANVLTLFVMTWPA